MTISHADLLADAAAIQDDLVALRRELHTFPERDLDLPLTQKRTLDALEGLPLEIHLGKSLSSIVAVLDSGKPGPTVLLRGDMDGLPVQEATGLDYASTNGFMHACGHDLHVAGLVGAARILSGRRDELVGKVVFMFQPGEEGAGGAQVMIEEGLLEITGEKPSAAFGIHVMSDVEAGTLVCKPGPFMAAVMEMKVTVHGAGGHGSMPFSAKDPVPAACEMVLALQAFVTREFNIFDPVVITVGTIHAGQAPNIIPAFSHFEATLRCFSEESAKKLELGSVRVVKGVAAAHGLEIDAVCERQYPATINDDAWAERCLTLASELFGPERVQRLANPSAGAEDFSFVLNEVPGSYMFLGAKPADRELAMNHSPLAAFDDVVLGDQAAMLAACAVDALFAG